MDQSLNPATVATVLLVILAMPVALTHRFRRAALNASLEERTVVWFDFVRCLRWTLLGSLVLWWAATDFVGLRGYAYEVSDLLPIRDSAVSDVVSLLLVWIPMLLVHVFCSVLAQPVYPKVRGIEWTRGELAKLSALRLGTTYVPLLIIVGGLTSTGEYSLLDFMACYAVAGAIWVVCRKYVRTQIQWTPQALTSGELRDQAFRMAEKLKVRLRQIYVLPAGKARMANAFASSANTILLTDFLLTRLNRHEVDAIVGHELAHLKHGHSKWLGGATAIVLIGVIAWYEVAGTSPWRPVYDILVCTALLGGFYFLSRRFEKMADATSAKLTGDPAALISGLVKVHALNLFPIRWGKWDEKLMRHPSAVRRAESIAKAAGMQVEDVPRILEKALAESKSTEVEPPDRYPLPAAVVGKSKVFSSEFKRRIQLQRFFLQLAAMALLPCLFVWAMRDGGWPTQSWQVLGIAFVQAVFLYLVLMNFLPALGVRRLKQRLAAKCDTEGVDAESWGGVLVGLSPGAAPRLYEGSGSWDLAYVLLTSDRLCYWGEEIRFALERGQIMAIKAGSGVPGWLASQTIYVAWHDENGEERIFGMLPADARSAVAASKATRQLDQRLRAWHAGGPDGQPAPPILAGLSTPTIGAVTGAPVRPRVTSILKLLLFVGCVTGTFSYFLGLWDDGAWGWWCVTVACLVTLFSLVPSLIYREPRPSQQIPAADSNRIPETN